jgi:hypothetical protein
LTRSLETPLDAEGLPDVAALSGWDEGSNIRIWTFRAGGGADALKGVGQDLIAPQQVPSDALFSVVCNPAWPLVRIGECFQVWVDLSGTALGRHVVSASVAADELHLVPLEPRGQNALRFSVAADEASGGCCGTIEAAVTFWDDDKQGCVCLRCAQELVECRCKHPSDLLELPKARAGSSAKLVAGTDRAAGSCFLSIQMRLPRNRTSRCGARGARPLDNCWLRKLDTRKSTGRGSGPNYLPKLMRIAIAVSGPAGPDGRAAEMTTKSGMCRLVAKNGAIAEKEMISHAEPVPLMVHTHNCRGGRRGGGSGGGGGGDASCSAAGATDGGSTDGDDANVAGSRPAAKKPTASKKLTASKRPAAWVSKGAAKTRARRAVATNGTTTATPSLNATVKQTKNKQSRAKCMVTAAGILALACKDEVAECILDPPAPLDLEVNLNPWG